MKKRADLNGHARFFRATYNGNMIAIQAELI